MDTTVRLQWQGRKDAEIQASAAPKGTAVKIGCIGREGFGTVLQGCVPDILSLAKDAASVKDFGFVYICAETAVGRKSGDAVFTDLLKVLLRAGAIASPDAPVVFRPHPDFPEETIVLFKEVFSDRIFQRGSVLRGFEGFSEIALACPESVGLSALSRGLWRRWSEMPLKCCPKGGTALFAGLDEASSGFIDCLRTREKDGARGTFVFSLDTAMQGGQRSIRRAVDAWNALKSAAERRADSFQGLDLYEARNDSEK